jgi:hypothetical protein
VLKLRVLKLLVDCRQKVRQSKGGALTQRGKFCHVQTHAARCTQEVSAIHNEDVSADNSLWQQVAPLRRGELSPARGPGLPTPVAAADIEKMSIFQRDDGLFITLLDQSLEAGDPAISEMDDHGSGIFAYLQKVTQNHKQLFWNFDPEPFR